MKKIPLGNTGDLVSQYCLGCMLMGTQTSQSNSYRMLDRFVANGGNFLDTANCYAWWLNPNSAGDESETLLGQWMKDRGNRQQIFLATKGGARLTDPRLVRNSQGEIEWSKVPQTYERLSPGTIKNTAENSLRRLQTDSIDLYYVHIDDFETPLEEILGALNELVTQGKVHQIACSNWRTWRLERARSISKQKGWPSFVGIQQQYSYFRPKAGADFGVGVNVDDELLHYLRHNPDVTLMAYSPLLKGIYDDEKKRKSSYIWNQFDNDDSQARMKVLTEMAEQMNVTNSELVYAWLLHHHPRVIPIIGARTLEQFDIAMNALKIQLTGEQMSILKFGISLTF